MIDATLEGRYEFRDALVRDLEEDLMGPESPEEVVTDPPITKYIIGVLFPQSSDSIETEAIDEVEDDGDEVVPPDPAVALAHVRYPSSMGLSFAVDPSATRMLRVRVECGRYEQVDGEAIDATATPSRSRRAASNDRPWRRSQIDETLEIALDALDSGTRRPVQPGLELFTRTRRTGTSLAVTCILINTHRTPAGSLAKDPLSFFQASIKATAVDAVDHAFVERPAPGLIVDDADLRAYSLLYRHARVYAIGHGCAATWRIDGRETDQVATSYIPSSELAIAVSNPEIDLPCLSLRFLAHEERSRVVEALAALPSAYRDWIADRSLDHLEAGARETADDHLASCSAAADRMEAGIGTLRRDDTAWSAFRLASRAMLTVRSRADWHREGRPGDGPGETDKVWYPFQLGFLLLCVAGVADDDSPDRDLVDLLWFPTGGGKTEAYLGLIAFTLFLRRLRLGPSGAGVTALMRYTLRLLTIQQFERAAALIVVCELLRRDNVVELGDEPISLGLWVGRDGTPNNRTEAQRQLKKLRAGGTIDSGNPVQLKSCPWCGTKLDADNYYVNRERTRLMIACPSDLCPFRKGLPVVVVDDDVYDTHPTLIIATADKFAGIAWRPEAHQLFNLDRPGTPPFELIIQDELHLISGPLGTLSGLYEAAIDLTSSSGGRRPKIVASTATIRRADAQSEALFGRHVRQFPPPGIDARDSFFAVESSRDEKGARLYLGLMAPGSSQTTLLVRAYSRVLQSALETPGDDKTRDPYWTLLGYFNSLRVLGGARMQVHNDVEDRLRLLEPDDALRRPVDKVIELTSRESSADIPGYLDQMGHPLPNALDVVLATNMISVGVDIDRLGLMVVMGQPQGTAEYIQATSRVGRKYPGLVVVLLNAGRSRDRSHYEAFLGYHGALYRQVESSSVTPFSPRARDRALHAVLIASVRMRVPELRDNEAAGRVRKHLAQVHAIRDELIERAKFVAPDDAPDVAAQLDGILERWLRRAEMDPKLKYRDKTPGVALLVDAAEIEGDASADEDSFGTLWSLRDVDRASNLYLLR